MMVLGVTPLALWGSAQVLMVLISSSMVMARVANIFTCAGNSALVLSSNAVHKYLGYAQSAGGCLSGSSLMIA